MFAPLLRTIAEQPAGAGIQPLVRLAALLRPGPGASPARAVAKVRELAATLEADADLRAGLRRYLLDLLSPRRKSHLFSDVGILDNLGFGETLRRRLAYKLLPPVVNDKYLSDLIGMVFYRRDDAAWVEAVPDGDWRRLFSALGEGFLAESGLRAGALEALRVLSYRVATLGIEPEFVRNHPSFERGESPFLRQSEAVLALLARQDAPGWADLARDAESHLARCRDVVQRVARHATRSGVSISLTYLLRRLDQSLTRMNALLSLAAEEQERAGAAGVRLFKDLVAADGEKYSLRAVYSQNVDLLALRVTENASKTGDNYVSTDRAGYVAMVRSALGAGFVVSFMALFKLLAAKLRLAPVGEALAFGLNYSLGFMFIHLVHFTVATKQPAMTAATIAASLGRYGASRDEALDGVANLTRDVFRTQFVAIAGNVALAFPMAVMLSFLIRAYGAGHLVDEAKAVRLLAEIDPFASPSLVYAAVAGVCLFLSGLISGYYDNKAAYGRLPDRLRQHRRLRRLLGAERLDRLAGYVDANWGALAGNFFLGLMLGGMPTLGFILGLPLDIRHITFSAANAGYAFAALDFGVAPVVALRSAAGIAGIGLTNLLVSFSLALWVAMRSRGVSYEGWLPLFRLLLGKFLRSPASFFWPPAAKPPAPEAPSDTSPV